MNLDQRMHHADRSSRWHAYTMIAPVLLFVMLSFIMPLGMILLNSIYDPVIPDGLSHTVTELQVWDGPRDQLPPETVYAALAQDMKKAAQEQRIGSIANRLNIEQPGLHTVFMKTAQVVNNCVINKEPLQPFMTLMALYGDPKHKSEAMCHKWGWFQNPLRNMLESVGMTEIKFCEPNYHFPFRDMRVECLKAL